MFWVITLYEISKKTMNGKTIRRIPYVDVLGPFNTHKDPGGGASHHRLGWTSVGQNLL